MLMRLTKDNYVAFNKGWGEFKRAKMLQRGEDVRMQNYFSAADARR